MIGYELRNIGYILSILAIVISTCWFIFEPGFEPIITFLTGLAGLLFSLRSGKTRKRINKVANSTSYDNEAINTPKSSTIRDQNQKVELPEIAFEILKSFAQLRDLEAASTCDVAHSFHLSEQQAKYYLDLLEKEGLTSGPYHLDEGQQYSLSQKGRALLFENRIDTFQSASASINHPEFFPHLNLVALKKHILKLINEPSCPFNNIIKRVALYQGIDSQRYVLVIEAPEDHPDSTKLLSVWQAGDLRFLVDESFREVYRDKSNYDPFLEEWFIWTKPPGDDLPEDLVLREYHWLLFEKNINLNFHLNRG